MKFDKYNTIILITWALVALSSIAFERINDDEVIYFVNSAHILSSGPTTFGNLIFVPLILGAVAVRIWSSILSVRIVSAAAVLATSLLIYRTKKDDSTFIASMLYLTSFYTIRFGMRFYLDPFGGLFVVAAIYSLYKSKSRLSGAASMLAAFSRELAAPLVLVFAAHSYLKSTGLRRFLSGAVLVLIPGLVWISLSTGIPSAAAGGSSNVLSIFAYATGGLPSMLVGWAQYRLISPMVVVGLLFCRSRRSRPELFPGLFSIAILTLTPGFILNGAASEYPYIFNGIACLMAGSGLVALAQRVGFKKVGLGVIIGLMGAQFAAQSYAATAQSPNGIVGVQDYGYSYDQQLLSYLNANYNGGKVYASNLDGLLDQRLAANWVWMPQEVEPALKANPAWVVTFASYVRLGPVPSGVTVVSIGPFVVVHQINVTLATFVTPTNVSSWKF